MIQGINVDFWKRHSPEMAPFNDVFRTNDGPRRIRSNGTLDNPWSSLANVDEYGWPKAGETIGYWLQPNKEGKYILQYDHEYIQVDVKMQAGVREVNRTSIFELEIMVDDVSSPPHGGIQLRIKRLSEDAVPFLECYHQDSPNTTFTRQYLDYLEPYKVLRFMNTFRTNDIDQGKVENTLQYQFDLAFVTEHTPWGGSILTACELLRKLPGKDMWDCVPDKPEDWTDQKYEDYIRERAEVLKNSLSTGVHVYVEHSNEVWNSGFPQQKRLLHRAESDPTLTHAFPTNKWYRARALHAIETNTIGRIYKEVLGPNRVTCLLAGQHYQLDTVRRGLDYLRDSGRVVYVDGIAIAPYLGHDVTSDMTVEQTVDKLKEEFETFHTRLMSYVNFCNEEGLNLYAYEINHHINPDNKGYRHVPEVVDEVEKAFKEIIEVTRMGCLFKQPGVNTVWSLNEGDELKKMYDSYLGSVTEPIEEGQDTPVESGSGPIPDTDENSPHVEEEPKELLFYKTEDAIRHVDYLIGCLGEIRQELVHGTE